MRCVLAKQMVWREQSISERLADFACLQTRQPETLFYVSGCLVVWQKRTESYFFKSAKISSTVFFASPKHITVFSLKNSGFCTPA